MKTSNILLIIGMVVLLTGAVLSICKIEPYADYVLVGGAVIILFRGAVRSRERSDESSSDNRMPQ